MKISLYKILLQEILPHMKFYLWEILPHMKFYL